MSTIISHYSVLQFSVTTPGRLLFPGQQHLPSTGTLGYVRSEIRAQKALSQRTSSQSSPWRDYSPAVLTHTEKVVDASAPESRVIISARNVINEFGYRARIAGTWWGRKGDAPLDPEWPVLTCSPAGLCMRTLAEAESKDTDILTGVPLVRQGQPSDRHFLIASCSDVAHSYEVHPKGLIGPSAAAWTALSDAWEQGKDQGLSDEELAARLQKIADAYGAEPSRNLLHSMVGQRRDGTLLFVAITGPLDGIAQLLVSVWDVQEAIILDNGGSVGWLYYPGNDREPILLVAGPNRRPAGTVFLELLTDGFPQPRAHGAFQ